MKWFIIGILTYFFIRLMFGEEPASQGTSTPRRRDRPPRFNEEAFAKYLSDKSEKELWQLRNDYHAELIKSRGTEGYNYFLDCIGVIDKQIDKLRHS